MYICSMLEGTVFTVHLFEKQIFINIWFGAFDVKDWIEWEKSIIIIIYIPGSKVKNVWFEWNLIP